MAAPYPIYFNKRPLRAVFLVKQEELTVDVFAQIFNYNLRTFNGRFNPIIFSDGKKLGEKAWEFLKDYDPDVIKILFKPEKDLLQKIEDWLSPYEVTLHNPAGHIGTGHAQDITINRPTKDLIARLSNFHAFQASSFIFFNLKNLTNEKHKQFIHFNFGSYDDWMITQQSEKVDPKQVFDLDSAKSISVALADLAKIQKHPVFPIQLSTVPNAAKDVEYNDDNEHFTVIVGDSPQDLAHYWNKSLSIPHWLRHDICHIWLPLELAEDEDAREGLQIYFQRRTAQVGNNNGAKYIKFVSFSLTEEKLKGIAESLGQQVWGGKRVEIHPPIQKFPDYGPHRDYFHPRQGMDLYQANSEEEMLVVDEYELPEGVHGGHWMLDVYIQYRPERFGYTNVRHWWRLPNRNHLTRAIFPNKIARVQANGIPSVVMETKSSFKPDEANLTIKIPEDDDIIRGFIFGHNRPVFTGDPRAAVINEKNYFHTQRSDKGRYLHGL